MNKIKLVVFLCMLLPTMAFAAGSKMVILDPMQAILNTDYVQSRQNSLQSELKGKEAEAKKLAGELRSLQANLQKNGMTMSKKEQQAKQKEFGTKNMKFRALQQQIKKRVQGDHREVLETLRPKLQKAIADYASKHNVDVVLNAQATLFAQRGMDITKDITASLNAMKLK